MPPEEGGPRDEGRRDEGHWAKPVSQFHLAHEVPADAINLNVEGRRPAGVAGGFGQMWQKTYRVQLRGATVTPKDVIAAWKSHFPEFWPRKARFYAPLDALGPGDVALLNMKIGGGVKMSTGVLVLYADDESFSFMMPEGGMFNGMITFSASTVDGHTVAQVQALIRAQDPLYEMGMKVGIAHRQEDKHWKHTLTQLAKYFGVSATVEMDRTLVDRKRQWKQFGNIRRSAALRSALYMLTAPFRKLAGSLRLGRRG